MTDRDRFSRRRFLQATGGAAAAISLAGCLGGDGGDDGDGTDDGDGNMTPQKGGRLNRLNSTMGTLDPVASDDTASGEVISQVFDPLTHYPHGETVAKKQLAEKIETNSDKTTYTITLTDATFHNGDTVTAKDVVYSWERLAGSPHSVRSSFILGDLQVVHETDSDGAYKPGTLGVEAKDEKTVEMRLKGPFHQVLSLLAYSSFAVVPNGIVGSLKDEGTHDKPSKQYTEFANSNPVGAGPFKFKKWKKQEEAEVTRYEDYHGQTAYVEGVHWKILEDDDAALNYAMEGNADIFGIPTANYDPSKVNIENTDDKGRKTGTYGKFRGKTFDYLKYPELSTFFIAFNAQNVPKPVRQAVAYVFDTESFVTQVFKDRNSPAYHLTPKSIYPGGVKGYESHYKENYPYGVGESDTESAKKVMEDAGYGPNNRYKLKFTHYESKAYSEFAKNQQNKLKPAYIDIEINQAKFQTLLNQAQQAKVDMYSMGWVADWPAADSFVKLLNPPENVSGNPESYMYLDWGRKKQTKSSKQSKQAFKTVKNNLSPTDAAQKKRDNAYVKMEEANWEDVIILPTHHRSSELFSYQDTHIPDKVGGMGISRSRHNTIWKEQ